MYRALSLMVKHVAHNNEDAGSTPARPTRVPSSQNQLIKVLYTTQLYDITASTM